MTEAPVLVSLVLWACSASGIQSYAPLVHTHSGLVVGKRLTLHGKDVDAFLGIPYAEPPVGNLRFRNPVPKRPWDGTFNATSKPRPCWQLPLRFLNDAPLNYNTTASEDCLYLNVWRPASNCSQDASCGEKRPVVVFIHGGGFQWGDSALFLYDAANFVATSDVVFVTFNYRLSILGFLSLETPELPGNMGLWDQNMVLRWVQRNIGHFGGDSSRVTLSGQSAGGISVGLHAASPQSRGLFKRVIMESGTPLGMIIGINYRGTGKFIGITGALGCYDSKKGFQDQVSDVMSCLRKLDASYIFETLESQEPIQQLFSPVHGDEFLPNHPLSPKTWKNLEFEEILLGNNLNEGTVFYNNLQFAFPGLIHALASNYRLAVPVALSPIFNIPLHKAREIVNAYFGGYEVEHDEESVVNIFSELFGDAVFTCPTVLFAEITSEQAIPTYRYVFAHRGSHSFWPEWMGVAHADELPYTFGSLLFLNDTERFIEPIGSAAAAYLKNKTYTPDESKFMNEIVSMWGSFVRDGRPLVPKPGVMWPQYTTQTLPVLYLQPNNFTLVRDPKQNICELWRPFLLIRQH